MLLAGFFVSVSVVRADIITFRYEGELTEVDTPLEGQFSVGDSFGGTYTFESDTPSVTTYFTDENGFVDSTTYLFSNAIKALNFNSGSYVAVTESGDIESNKTPFSSFDYLTSSSPIDGFSVGGYVPQEISVSTQYYFGSSGDPGLAPLNHEAFDYSYMSFSFEEVGSQNSSYTKWGYFFCFIG